MNNNEKPYTVSVEAMRKSDAWTIEHEVDSKELMRRAGEAIFKAGEWIPPVGIVCGKGNNAGDGYVVADYMKKAGIECELVILDFEHFSEDGKYYFDKCLEEGIPAKIYISKEDLEKYNSILDCIFGTGFKGDVTGIAKNAIDAINAKGVYVVSADINSGLNGDTGEGSTYVKSDLTVSIGTFKHGHFRGLADEAMKKKINADIGIKIIE